MANPRLIKKRVSSIKNIGKITKALEMVAASKVQKAQNMASNAKPYAFKIYELVKSLEGERDISEISLMRVPEKIENDLYILISTNRGLAGSLNTNLFRFLTNHLEKNKNINHNFATVGKKGRGIAMSHGKLLADFSDKVPFMNSVSEIVKLAADFFNFQSVDAVYLVFNDFITALNQEPTIKPLLPINKTIISEEIENNFQISGKAFQEQQKTNQIEQNSYNFEPSANQVLSELLPFYLEVEVSEAILEAEASEHSARMIAMKSASENAKDLTETLTLVYNKERQGMITTEISDITTASLGLV